MNSVGVVSSGYGNLIDVIENTINEISSDFYRANALIHYAEAMHGVDNSKVEDLLNTAEVLLKNSHAYKQLVKVAIMYYHIGLKNKLNQIIDNLVNELLNNNNPFYFYEDYIETIETLGMIAVALVNIGLEEKAKGIFTRALSTFKNKDIKYCEVYASLAVKMVEANFLDIAEETMKIAESLAVKHFNRDYYESLIRNCHPDCVSEFEWLYEREKISAESETIANSGIIARYLVEMGKIEEGIRRFENALSSISSIPYYSRDPYITKSAREGALKSILYSMYEAGLIELAQEIEQKVPVSVSYNAIRDAKIKRIKRLIKFGLYSEAYTLINKDFSEFDYIRAYLLSKLVLEMSKVGLFEDSLNIINETMNLLEKLNNIDPETNIKIIANVVESLINVAFIMKLAGIDEYKVTLSDSLKIFEELESELKSEISKNDELKDMLKCYKVKILSVGVSVLSR
jgi:tetratricopeptide (TPR) repeat protein